MDHLPSMHAVKSSILFYRSFPELVGKGAIHRLLPVGIISLTCFSFGFLKEGVDLTHQQRLSLIRRLTTVLCGGFDKP